VELENSGRGELSGPPFNAIQLFAGVPVSRTQAVDDEFDLDIRLGASGWSLPDDIREGAGYDGIYAAEEEEKEKHKHPTHHGGNVQDL
jgi:hypothetical protein